jgi:hypothetical protein
VRARLLGIRLLTLEANVVIAPTEVTVPWAQSNDPSHRSPARSSSLPPARSGAIGGGLADASRSIDEGAALLAEARNGSAGPRRKSDASATGRRSGA